MSTIAYVKCSRWDEEEHEVIVEFITDKDSRDNLLDNITPGAVAKQYDILGEPKFVDTTYSSGNTIFLTPVSGSGLYSLRPRTKIAVKNYSETLLTPDTFKIKIRGIKL